MADVAATRSAALALVDERALMRQGYQFLDEKRVLIAGEILRELREYEARDGELRARLQAARGALRDALQRHGLEGLAAYPSEPPLLAPRPEARRMFLGVPLMDATLPASPPAELVPVDASPEARACAGAFRAVLDIATRVAACAANLERLAVEYRRTERRARALENVLLPEVERALAGVQEQLDLADLEEVAHSRLAGRGGDG
jgi:V/A-type H+-transporting ATPase subunit D